MPRKYPMPRPASNKKAAPVKEVKGDTPDAIRKMEKAELEKLAAERGVDISACKNNGERADAIVASIFGGGQ